MSVTGGNDSSELTIVKGRCIHRRSACRMQTGISLALCRNSRPSRESSVTARLTLDCSSAITPEDIRTKISRIAPNLFIDQADLPHDRGKSRNLFEVSDCKRSSPLMLPPLG